MAEVPERPPFLGTWRRIYLVVLLNLAAWVAILALFTRNFEPAL